MIEDRFDVRPTIGWGDTSVFEVKADDRLIFSSTYSRRLPLMEEVLDALETYWAEKASIRAPA